MAERRTPPSKSTSRKLAQKSPRYKILVVCEGKNTEKDYVQRFARQHGNNLVEVIVEPAAGVPLSVVKKPFQKKKT